MRYGKPLIMTKQPSSRLPTAFIRVSRCPICKYSLRDIAQDHPCPECGNIIDRDLLTSPEMQDAVAATKTWCTLGVIGWLFIGFAIWLIGMLNIALAQSYAGHIPGPFDFPSVWLRTAFVLAPISLCVHWFRGARPVTYRIATRPKSKKAKTPRRVIFVALPGVVFGLFSCGLFTLLLSAN